jgi:hypothetical protein
MAFRSHRGTLLLCFVNPSASAMRRALSFMSTVTHPRLIFFGLVSAVYLAVRAKMLRVGTRHLGGGDWEKERNNVSIRGETVSYQISPWTEENNSRVRWSEWDPLPKSCDRRHDRNGGRRSIAIARRDVSVATGGTTWEWVMRTQNSRVSQSCNKPPATLSSRPSEASAR